MFLENKEKIFIRIAALFGLSAVIFGAAGTHAVHDPSMQALMEKASIYQLIHAVALLALLAFPKSKPHLTYYCWIGGMLLFSGSLYLKAFGMIATATLAPIGGILLMIGWINLLR